MLQMERISSRKNGYIASLRRLAAEGELRRELGETVLDGEKLLREALASGCEVTSVLADERRIPDAMPESARLYVAPGGTCELCVPGKEQPRTGVHHPPAGTASAGAH